MFLEKRNNKWNSPYLFNGKERDEETGLSYYGARYYNSRVSNWLSVDSLAEKYSGRSAYCTNNPVKYVDPTGFTFDKPDDRKAKGMEKNINKKLKQERKSDDPNQQRIGQLEQSLIDINDMRYD